MISCRGSINFLLLTALVKYAASVDRSAFKTCDEASFCKRHRRPSSPHPAYKALAETIKVEDLSFTIELENVASKLRLKLKLSSYGDNRIGVLIDEVEPLRQRFRATDSFAKSPIKRGFRDSKADKSAVTLLTLDNQKIIVHFEPFRIDVLDEGDLVMTLNSQNLLKVEHFRKKREKVEDTSQDSLQQQQQQQKVSETEEKSNKEDEEEVKVHDDSSTKSKTEKTEASAAPVETTTTPAVKPIDSDHAKKEESEKEEEGFWDEHYKSHLDSKPFGSSSVGMDISFVGFNHVYGIPEHADSFALKSTTHSEPYRLYNLDVFEYELNNPMALYGAVPYIVGHSQERTVGILWLNPSETWIDIKSSIADKSIFRSLLDKFKSAPEIPQIDTHWISETGLIDVYIFVGPSPRDLFRQFTDFFGSTPLPPYFSIGYHQCRWNYNDMDDVQDVQENFDKYEMPMDVMWLDIEHADGKRYFTWDLQKFSDPKRMIENLEARGRKLVNIVDPHIRKDQEYFIYKEAQDLDYFVKDRDNNVFEGWCWPGASMYLDFLNPTVRDWWASKYAFDKYNGTTESVHIWNDMNEPSVFNGPEVTMHKDCKHYGGWEHRDVHNMYGFYNHMATYKGLVQRTEGRKRPFVLTRSFFLGSQRYTSVWTGDNTGEWSHLQVSFPMLLSLSVAGIPFVGADVGGFFRNPDEELLVRWYQAGVFNPFFRAHAHIDTKRREPWLFSENARNIIRQALTLRYQMLPYWYTVFYEHFITGLPVIRPLWVEFPKDVNTYSEESAVLIGSSILARPVTQAGVSSVSVYLPGDKSIWYDWDTMTGLPGPGATTVQTPLNKIPVFLRGGSIVPLKMRLRRSTVATKHDPLTLFVALDLSGKFANGSYYFDDGETFDYQNGAYCHRLFEYYGNEVSGLLTSRKLSGNACETDVWVEKIIIMGMKFKPVKIEADARKDAFFVFDYKPDTRVLAIRKPDLNVASDWTIRLTSL